MTIEAELQDLEARSTALQSRKATEEAAYHRAQGELAAAEAEVARAIEELTELGLPTALPALDAAIEQLATGLETQLSTLEAQAV